MIEVVSSETGNVGNGDGANDGDDDDEEEEAVSISECQEDGSERVNNLKVLASRYGFNRGIESVDNKRSAKPS